MGGPYGLSSCLLDRHQFGLQCYFFVMHMANDICHLSKIVESYALGFGARKV